MEVVQPQPLLQSEEVSEIHMRNPNYKGKNYDPNFQVKHAEAVHSAGKQQQNSFVPPTSTNQHTTNQRRHTARTTARHSPTLLTSLGR